MSDGRRAAAADDPEAFVEHMTCELADELLTRISPASAQLELLVALQLHSQLPGGGSGKHLSHSGSNSLRSLWHQTVQSLAYSDTLAFRHIQRWLSGTHGEAIKQAAGALPAATVAAAAQRDLIPAGAEVAKARSQTTAANQRLKALTAEAVALRKKRRCEACGLVIRAADEDRVRGGLCCVKERYDYDVVKGHRFKAHSC